MKRSPSPRRCAPPLSHAGRGEMNQYERWNIPESLRARMVEVARAFRKEPTASEAILWGALRARRLAGRKFRRQQPIGPFVVDFFCAEERLIVEVDGPIHHKQQEADAQRQSLIESLGLRFVRLPAVTVETDLDTALQRIADAFFDTPCLSSTPSPLVGEGAGGEGT
jgi:very-short-patch-repair endonuclease